MLYVKTPEEVLALIESEFFPLEQAEFVALSEVCLLYTSDAADE